MGKIGSALLLKRRSSSATSPISCSLGWWIALLKRSWLYDHNAEDNWLEQWSFAILLFFTPGQSHFLSVIFTWWIRRTHPTLLSPATRLDPRLTSKLPRSATLSSFYFRYFVASLTYRREWRCRLGWRRLSEEELIIPIFSNRNKGVLPFSLESRVRLGSQMQSVHK